MPNATPNLAAKGLAALMALALAACGQSDVDAGGGGGAEGSGALTAQIKASCVDRVQTIGDFAGIGEEICDCASRRAQGELSIADLATGDMSALETIMTQCADEALASRAGANTNEAGTR